MAKHNSNLYTDFTNISVGNGSGNGILRFGGTLASALSSTDDKGLYVRGSNLYFWNGSSETNLLSGGGGGATSWEDLYNDDKTLTIDSTTLTFSLTHATNNGLTLTGSGNAGHVLQITNAGTGKDINGTSDTWSVTKTGNAVFTKVDLGDDQVVEFGASDDATIQWVGSGDVLDIAGATNFDGNMIIEAAHTLTIAGGGGSTVFTITAGDAVMSDASLAITDADNAETVTIINNTATTIGAAASAAIVQLESTSLTTGALLGLQLTEGTLNGGSYLRAWDATGGAAVFTVAEDGVTTIAGVAAGSNSVVVTSGSLFLSDTDASVIESEDGTTTLLTLDNKAGVIADNSGVLLLDAGGAVASGGNILRMAFTGTPNAGAIGFEFVGASIDAAAVVIDSDAATNSAVLINGGGAIASAKAVLQVTADGTPASGGNVVDIRFTGTATNSPALLNMVGTGKAVNGILIDTDNTSQHGVSITGSGALASGGRMFKVTNDGTPAAATDAVAEITFGGTATNNPVVLNVNNGTANAAPLLVTSNVASATRAAGTFIQDSTTGAIATITLQQDDVSEEFIAFNSTAGSGQAVDLTNTTPAAIAGSVIVSAVDGTLYRMPLYAAAGWSA